MMRNEIFWFNHLRPPSHAASSCLILVSVPANWQIDHPRKFAIDHMSIGVLRIASFVTYILGSGSCAGVRPSLGCMLCCICFVQTDIHGLTVTPRTRTHHAAGVFSSHSVIKVPWYQQHHRPQRHFRFTLQVQKLWKLFSAAPESCRKLSILL